MTDASGAALSLQKGSCLCGAVTFSFTPEAMEMGACHCSMCRKWSGGAFLAVHAASPVDIQGEEHVGVYVSSDWGERCFCKTCGSILFWRTRDRAMTAVAAQTLDNDDAFPLTSEIFIDEKPETFAFAGDTKKMTGAEVMAMFAPKES